MIDDERLHDFYEVLQISPNADPDTIHRIYRLLAQRFHPDNQETGDPARFRQITEAYHVLSDPEQRAAFDVRHLAVRQERIKVVNHAAKANTDFEIEQLVRLTVLEALYTQRRVNPNNPGHLRPRSGRAHRAVARPSRVHVLVPDLEEPGQARRLVAPLITADGVDYLEQHYETNLQRKRLKEASGAPRSGDRHGD